MNDNEDLTKLVNASGFFLQLGLEHEIRTKMEPHRWRFVSREHPWKLRGTDAEGFIDLVLQTGIVLAVIECKRVRGGTWVFLVPDGADAQQIATRALWVAGTSDGTSMSGWDAVEHLPASHVSSFCVVRGSGENDRPMLERLCANLLMSVDALAEEELSILANKQFGWKGYYLPIVVTTAKLFVCRFHASQIKISDGTLDSAGFEEIPFIRFQKAFSTSSPPTSAPNHLADAAAARERTVLVVQADSLITMLTQFAEPAFRETYPWDKALAALRRKAP